MLLCGCFVDDIDFGQTMFECKDGKTCPDGFECRGYYCSPSPRDAAAFDTPPACGKMEAFADNFDNNIIDNPPWDSNTSGADEMGGEAVTTISAGVSGADSHYATTQRADLTSSHVYVEVLTVKAQTYLRAAYDDGHYLEIYQDEGFLWVKQDGNTILGPLPYDQVIHRWWRISENGGTVSFDTSLDGNSWVSRATTQTPFYAGSMTIQFGARTGNPQASTGAAQFDNLNGGNSPAGPCTRG